MSPLVHQQMMMKKFGRPDSPWLRISWFILSHVNVGFLPLDSHVDAVTTMWHSNFTLVGCHTLLVLLLVLLSWEIHNIYGHKRHWNLSLCSVGVGWAPVSGICGLQSLYLFFPNLIHMLVSWSRGTLNMLRYSQENHYLTSGPFFMPVCSLTASPPKAGCSVPWIQS